MRHLQVLLALGIASVACRSGQPPPAAPAPEPERCADVSGSFLFDSLAACDVQGSLRNLPVYPIESDGRRRGPVDRRDFLPLPLGHWADGGSRIELRQTGCSGLSVRLFSPVEAPSPYHAFEMPFVAAEGSGGWQMWQLPLGASKKREGWSLALSPEGGLDYVYSVRESSAVFLVIPWHSRFEVRCRLPRAS